MSEGKRYIPYLGLLADYQERMKEYVERLEADVFFCSECHRQQCSSSCSRFTKDLVAVWCPLYKIFIDLKTRKPAPGWAIYIN